MKVTGSVGARESLADMFERDGKTAIATTLRGMDDARYEDYKEFVVRHIEQMWADTDEFYEKLLQLTQEQIKRKGSLVPACRLFEAAEALQKLIIPPGSGGEGPVEDAYVIEVIMQLEHVLEVASGAHAN